MTEWQPIETAPKDGTKILLTPGEVETVTIGSFERPHLVGETGWRSIERDSDAWGCTYRMDIKPTHWMPIPDPPGTARA